MPFTFDVDLTLNMQITQSDAFLLSQALNFIEIPESFTFDDDEWRRISKMHDQLRRISTWKQPS